MSAGPLSCLLTQESVEGPILASALQGCLTPTLPPEQYALVKQLIQDALPGTPGPHQVSTACPSSCQHWCIDAARHLPV